MKSFRNYLTLAIVVVVFIFATLKIEAQQVESDWSKCPDGSAVVRCATYNCPEGDTNKDGQCTASDEKSKLTDLRNDALCANPPSGCGQVYYYNKDGKACASRIKDLDFCPIKAGDSFTPTVTPTPTPRSVGGIETQTAFCLSLTATPTLGKAPLLVKITAQGQDPKGEITEYEFNFGDSKSDKPQIVRQKSRFASYRYEKPGTYTLSVKVKDSLGNWIDGGSACSKKIVVTANSSELPKTGLSSGLGLALVGAFLSGVYLYSKFRIV